MNRAEFYTPSFFPVQSQLDLFAPVRELTELTLHERINYRHNSKNYHPYDDHLYPYEQYVKAIRFHYSKGYMHQFTEKINTNI